MRFLPVDEQDGVADESVVPLLAPPQNDGQMTIQASNIVRYSGNQIDLFYGSNSWVYIKQGYINSLSTDELASVLENASVSIALFTG